MTLKLQHTYLSTHEWSFTDMSATASRPPASPTKKELSRSIRSASSRSWSSKSSLHIPTRGLRYSSRPVAAYTVIGKSSWLSTAEILPLKSVNRFWSDLMVFGSGFRLMPPWLLTTARRYLYHVTWSVWTFVTSSCLFWRQTLHRGAF